MTREPGIRVELRSTPSRGDARVLVNGVDAGASGLGFLTGVILDPNLNDLAEIRADPEISVGDVVKAVDLLRSAGACFFLFPRP